MIPVKILALQFIPNAAPALCDQLGVSRDRPSLGLITTDSDDATYIALDEATKAADVTVSYGRSFYAGAANASTPYAGEAVPPTPPRPTPGRSSVFFPPPHRERCEAAWRQSLPHWSGSALTKWAVCPILRTRSAVVAHF